MIAALISADGAPRELVLRWLAGEFEMLASPMLLVEFERVLLRPKFRSYATEEEATRFVAIVRRLSGVAPDPSVQPGITADPHDDYLVALAYSTNSGVLVSGERHLLDFAATDLSVLSPRGFVASLDAGRGGR